MDQPLRGTFQATWDPDQIHPTVRHLDVGVSLPTRPFSPLVARPVLVSATENGVVAPAAIRQAFFRLGAVIGAIPWMSATRLVCV